MESRLSTQIAHRRNTGMFNSETYDIPPGRQWQPLLRKLGPALRRLATLGVPVVLVILFFAGCATRIGPGRVGIKVDLAGSQRGVEDLPTRTGWVFYNFLSSTIVEY